MLARVQVPAELSERLLLDQASAGSEDLRQQIAATLASVAKLLQASKLEEAVQLLQMQPGAVLRSSRVQMALAAIQEERHQAVFRTVGRAFALLESDLPAGQALIAKAAAACSDPSFGAAIADAFRSRGQTFADQAVEAVIRASKVLLRDRDRDAAEKLLLTVSRAVAYASPEMRLDWERLRKKASATTLLSRLRA